ncbi:hypothetical protein OSTOST_12508 [Ostertagia ostertagi]
MLQTCALLLTVALAAAFDSSELRMLEDEYAMDKRAEPMQPREERSFEIGRAPEAHPLIRFGKRSPDNAPFIRFGRNPEASPLIRFGKRSPAAPLIRSVRTFSQRFTTHSIWQEVDAQSQ